MKRLHTDLKLQYFFWAFNQHCHSFVTIVSAFEVKIGQLQESHRQTHSLLIGASAQKHGTDRQRLIPRFTESSHHLGSDFGNSLLPGDFADAVCTRQVDHVVAVPTFNQSIVVGRGKAPPAIYLLLTDFGKRPRTCTRRAFHTSINKRVSLLFFNLTCFAHYERL